MKIASTNPATGKVIMQFSEYSDKDVMKYIDISQQAFETYKDVNFSDRSKLMKKASEILLRKKKHYAKIITLEMGKPISESIAEIEKCAWVCEYYADNTESLLKDEEIESDASRSFISFEPLGIILAVMPWNFPFWQVFRFAAPALMAGNVCLLKHASNVPQCALAIEEIFNKAQFPEGAFKTLLIGSNKVKKIIGDTRVQGVTLTGSDIAGSKVAELAGKNIKKTVLELGGSDPFIILSDAVIKDAAAAGIKSKMINAGQSCIAAKRFIVVKSVADDFMKLIIYYMKSLKVGDPMDSNTDIGPLARDDLAEHLLQQVRNSVKKGAEVIFGGDRPKRSGAYFNPTILYNVKKGMPAYDEEMFGPVAAIIVVENEEEAIQVANDSQYGLGASIWTTDIEKGTRLARKIQSGGVFVNGMVKSDPRVPFGGIKRSGYGRELSYLGIKEFLNQKTVWIG